MWTCPKCRRKFKAKNQWHSCAKVDLEYHLNGKSPAVRKGVEKLLREIRKFGKFSIDPVKSFVLLKTSTAFLAIKPGKEHLEIEFQLATEVKEFPVYKTLRMSPQRILHSVILQGPGDVDAWLIRLLKEAYGLSRDLRSK